jgi:hypothetical protein
LDVIVPILVSRKDNAALKLWLNEWKSNPCTCVRIIAVLDSSGATINDTEALHEAIFYGMPEEKKILTLRGLFGSPGAARNIGLHKSTAKWIAFWDSDDSPLIETMGAVLGDIENSPKSIHVYQYESWSLESGKRVRISRDKDLWTLARHPGLWRMIIPGDVARQFKFPQHLMGEDIAYFVQLIMSGQIKEIKFFSDKLYIYNIHSENQLTGSIVALKDLEKSLDFLSHSLSEKNKAEKSMKQLASMILLYQFISLLKRQPMVALKKLMLFPGIFLSRGKLNTISNDVNKLVKDSEKQVFIYTMGGLGNQLFQYAAARYYCGYDARINFICDAGSPRLDRSGIPMIGTLLDFNNRKLEFITIGKHSLFFSRIANVLLRVHIHKHVMINNRLVRNTLSLISRPILSIILGRKVGLIVCHDHGFTPNYKIRGSNTLVIGYFQSYEYAKSVEKELRERLKKVVTDSLNDKVDVNAKNPPNGLVIHVRRGDYLGEKEIGCLEDTYFVEALQRMLDARCYEEVWVMVESEEQSRFLKKYLPECSYVFTGEEYSTLESLALMSLGSGFIVSNSTFSWWGAFLGSSRDDKSSVLAPSPWYREIRQPNRLIPDSWEKKDSSWIEK